MDALTSSCVPGAAGTAPVLRRRPSACSPRRIAAVRNAVGAPRGLLALYVAAGRGDQSAGRQVDTGPART